MKKIILSISALLLASSHLASANTDSCANSFSGFYAGVQAGMNRTSGEHTVIGGGSGLVANRVLGGDTKHSSNKKAFLGGLFAGYGMGVGSCTYFGGEIYVNLSNTSLLINKSTSGTFNGEKQTANNTYNFGAKARFGYTFSQKIMAFIGLGLERANWQIKDVSSATLKTSKSSFVFAPSVGVDMFMSNNIFVRGEFTYVNGPKVTINGSATTPIVNSGQTYKLKATQQRLALGVGYKF